MISEVWYVLSKSISWRESAMCLQSWHQISRKIFRLVRLRFRLSFFPGSHHLPWQLNCTTYTWSSSKTKTQELKHKKHEHTSPVKTTSTFLHDVPLRSVSNSKFWMPSRTLLSPSSLRDPWKLQIPSTYWQHANMSGKHPLSLSTQRNLRNALRAFCSKTIQFQVVSLGIAPF